MSDKIAQADQDDLFALELQNPVRLKQTFPTGTPSTLDDDVRVQAIDHRITRQSHTMTLSFGLPS